MLYIYGVRLIESKQSSWLGDVRVNDAAENLTASGVVEKDLVLSQRREVASDLLHVHGEKDRLVSSDCWILCMVWAELIGGANVDRVKH